PTDLVKSSDETQYKNSQDDIPESHETDDSSIFTPSSSRPNSKNSAYIYNCINDLSSEGYTPVPPESEQRSEQSESNLYSPPCGCIQQMLTGKWPIDKSCRWHDSQINLYALASLQELPFPKAAINICTLRWDDDPSGLHATCHVRDSSSDEHTSLSQNSRQSSSSHLRRNESLISHTSADMSIPIEFNELEFQDNSSFSSMPRNIHRQSYSTLPRDLS
ncbi:unnamed protein product, partial [Meganyctiphanes norvegica]